MPPPSRFRHLAFRPILLSVCLSLAPSTLLAEEQQLLTRTAWTQRLVERLRPIELFDRQAMRDAGMGGRYCATIGFHAGPDGELSEVQVVKSSGTPLYDRMAASHVSSSAPLPRFARQMARVPQALSLEICQVVPGQPRKDEKG